MKNCVEKIFGGLRGSYFSYALTYFSFYFGMGAFISVQSVYLMGLGKSTGEMSFIVSASSLFGIVLIPAVGYLNDRLKKPRLIAGLLLAAVAVLGAVFAASRSTWVLYVLNGLIMGLVSAISPVCERMAGSGRFRYGTVRVWGTIGYAAAAQLAGLVMEFIAPRMIFVLFGAAIAVAAAGFAGTDGIRFEQEAEKSTAADQLSFLSKPMFLLFAAIALVFSGMSNLNITYSPILLQELGLSTGFVGTALSLSTLVELPVIFVFQPVYGPFFGPCADGRGLCGDAAAISAVRFLVQRMAGVFIDASPEGGGLHAVYDDHAQGGARHRAGELGLDGARRDQCGECGQHDFDAEPRRLHRRSAWHPHDVFPAGRALGAGAAPQPFPARAECKKSVFLSVSSAVCAAEIEKQHKKEEN